MTKSKVLASVFGICMAVVPAFAAGPAARHKAHRRQSSDVQRAIAFQRHEDAAARREWRKEGNRDATWAKERQAAREDRNADRAMPGRVVGDPGELRQNSNGSQGNSARER